MTAALDAKDKQLLSSLQRLLLPGAVPLAA